MHDFKNSGQYDFYWLILNMAAEHSAAIVRNRRGTIFKKNESKHKSAMFNALVFKP